MAGRPRRSRTGPRILAADTVLPPERPPVPSEAASARLRSLQRAAAKGDMIEWTHFTLSSSGVRSRDSSVLAGRAKVEVADPANSFVIVKKPGGRKQLQIPREHITEREPPETANDQTSQEDPEVDGDAASVVHTLCHHH